MLDDFSLVDTGFGIPLWTFSLDFCTILSVYPAIQWVSCHHKESNFLALLFCVTISTLQTNWPKILTAELSGLEALNETSQVWDTGRCDTESLYNLGAQCRTPHIKRGIAGLGDFILEDHLSDCRSNDTLEYVRLFSASSPSKLTEACRQKPRS